jgi:transglutaminase-like putative cysteine protease
MQRYFHLSCHALVISAFLTLVLTGRLPYPAVIIFVAGLGLSCYRAIKELPPLVSARGGLFFSLVYILFFAFDMTMLSASFVSASIHLVLFLQLMKLFQEKKDRDYFYLIVLSFLQVLTASALTIDISFVAALFLFLAALVSTLMSFEMYRFDRNSKTGAQQVAVPIGGMSVWTTLWIVITGLILFLIIPRVGTGYFTRAAAESLLVTGFNDKVELGEIGQVKRSNAVVMHARQIGGTPFALVKWRGITLDLFDGRNWLKTDRQRFPVRPSAGGRFPIRPIVHPRDAVRYEIVLEPLATNALFGPHRVREVSGRLQSLEYDSGESVYLHFPTVRRIQYQVLSEIPDRTRLFANSPVVEDRIPDEFRYRYLQLPSDIDPRVQQLAQKITAKAKSGLEKAALIETYLKRNHAYTLDLTWTPGSTQPLSAFLFEAKAGHCEYFASAMAILLRTVDVPTRLVNGFLMGEYNSVDANYIIRQSDAHSWIEVYIPDRGWVEFDPTPPDPNYREVNLAVQLSHYIDALELFWNSYIIVYDSSAQWQLFRSAQDQVQSIQVTLREKSEHWMARGKDWSDSLVRWAGKFLGTPAFWAVLAAMAAGGAAYQYRRPIQTKLRIWLVRQGRGRATEDIVEQLFYRAAHLAQRKSASRAAGETWREWILGLPDPRRRSVLGKALIVFEKSKYGRQAVSAEDFSLLEQTIQSLKEIRG